MLDTEWTLIFSGAFRQRRDGLSVQVIALFLSFMARITKMRASPAIPRRHRAAKLALIRNVLLSMLFARFGIGSTGTRTAH